MLTSASAILAVATVVTAGDHLSLTIGSADETAKGGSPEVWFKITNVGETYAVLFPVIVPVRVDRDPQPWCVLNFNIEDETGRVAEHVGRSPGIKLKPPWAEEALVLPPGYFYGGVVSLTEGRFAYDLDRPGRYRVSGALVCTAREWLLSRVGTSVFPRGGVPPYDLGNVVSGRVESNVIVVNRSPSP